jgi:hypothetical protein
MGQSHRDIQDRDEELTSGTKRRTGVIVAGASIGVLLASLAAIPSFGSNEPKAGPRPLAVTDESREAWLAIASDLMDTVPAAVLLGGPGSDPKLDARLEDARLDRDLFRRTAIVIRGESSGVRDDVEQEAIAMSMRDIPVPEGFETTKQAGDDQGRKQPSLTAAHNLALELTGRLLHTDRNEHP